MGTSFDDVELRDDDLLLGLLVAFGDFVSFFDDVELRDDDLLLGLLVAFGDFVSFFGDS